MRFWTATIAIIALLVGIFGLERDRFDVPREKTNIAATIKIGETTEVRETPVTIYGKGPGPAVVIAHGFAGSRQLMEAYALSIAKAGYVVVSFDFEGHGRNPTKMSGDVTSVDGTTRLLVEETTRVVNFARTLPGVSDRVALLGHSMATDVIARVAIAEDIPIVIGISMFSQAVTAEKPQHLLMISGQFEGHLRAAAMDAIAMVAPGGEGETVISGDVTRRAVVAPGVEHVGVLYSQTGMRAAVLWLDAHFGRVSEANVVATGGWIILALLGIVLLGRPLSFALPPRPAPKRLPHGAFWAATILPAIITPLILAPLDLKFLPVLVADYLAVHAGVYGLLVLIILRIGGVRVRGWQFLPLAMMILWGIVLFGGFLDRYVASFFPITERLPIVTAIAAGTILAMVAEVALTQAGRASFLRKTATRLSFLGSLGIATALDFEGLFFLLLILPLIALFYASFGVMGGWVARRSGAVVATGAGLGLCLGWALAVSFPMFVVGQ